MSTSVTLQRQHISPPCAHRTPALRSVLVAFTGALLLAAGGTAAAAAHGGFGGGGHAAFGGGVARGGFARGGFARGGFARGAYGRPYGYGGRGYGWRGYGWRGYGWGPYWGLGGLGLGLYLATLPWDYSTYWWDGVPYYYANNGYYVWDGADGQYESVQPPAQVSEQAAHAPPMKLYAYPKNGQSAQQQAADTAECMRWAHQQVDAAPPGTPPGAVTGTRPGQLSSAPPADSSTAVGAIAAATGSPPGAGAAPGSQFTRAEAACLTGKGYSVD